MTEFEKIISSMDFNFFATGKHKIDAATFLASQDAILLDVRANEETSTIKLSLKHHLPVIEIPFNELPLNIDQLPKDKFIGVFCSSGVRSAITFAYIKSKGFENVKMIEGGYPQLIEAIMPGKIYKHLNK
ncbi:MAG: rhodanese-like domain-containing protein [Bacteroidales bacterium]|jgi:rhodanese-related sulfurtransferase|nr:rhodanese-like domain-containing protein [Bacteroidales bacterium]MDD3962531.1 rhodanese-like domain-containing protein [Bacteroidales bacterium]MDY0339261.1 rhodanese-like domain-containing protein [Acholeplasmataceae bacterium]NCD11922.1 rhodanese-like domain-containing protein [Campylobacterota bacterium]